MDWTNFWASNKKEIDPIAPRHTSVDIINAVKATVLNRSEKPYTEDKPKHNKNPAVGIKKVTYSKNLLFDQEDAKLFKQDEEITLMNWGNAYVRKIVGSNPVTALELELHLEGDVKKTEKKVTWLSSDQDLVKTDVYEFDYLMTKDKLEEGDNWDDFVNPHSSSKSEALVDANATDLKADDIIQLERKGYFRVDKAAEGGKGLVLFSIPTGKTK
jgi:glutamyl-tRNA synthetase